MTACRPLLASLILGLLALAAPVFAGDDVPWDTPTLHDLGLHAGSAESGVEVQASGQIDIEYLGIRGQGAGLLQGEKHDLTNGRARLFIDTFIGDHLYSLVELRGDRDEPPDDGRLSGRVEQAFLRYTPWTEHDFSIQAGKFVSPFGSYPTRHQTAQDPLIFKPLPYSFQTTVCDGLLPGGNDGWIRWKDIPFFRRGMPPIWDVPYQLGVMVFGSGAKGKVDYRLAVMTSGVSSRPDEWDTQPGTHSVPAFVAHGGIRLSPALKFGVNYQDGPYLLEQVEPRLPARSEIDDYRQRILGLEAEFAWGHLELRGEIFFDRWEVPRVRDEAEDVSWYIEGKYGLHPRLFAASRFGMISFNKVLQSNGTAVRWDYPARQWDIGLGARLTEHVLLRVGYQWNDVSRGTAPTDDMWAIRLSITF
ncbi:MAG: hypothetical protein HYY93_13055 [Planctomycetes bacterium]|nr:hypothetical protein [Planctomycetota bacterium]